MPKLSHPSVTKYEAIATLVDLYWRDPNFAKELAALRQPYAELVEKWGIAWINLPDEWLSLLPAEAYATIQGEFGPNIPSDLPREIDQRLVDYLQLSFELLSYLEGLTGLATKWKLKLRSSGFALLWYDALHVVQEKFKLPKDIDVPLDWFENLYPWKPLLPPLEIRVSSWAFMHLNQQEMVKIIVQELQKYEQKLKQARLHERPSALEKHAEWWFKHHVGGKSYPELQAEYNDEANPESIKRAVWNFSKLVGIKLRG